MPILSHIPISYIKKPFLWSLYYLKNNWTYENAIEDVIFRGGDIRSNAAIVGGLIGAVQGNNRRESKYYQGIDECFPKIERIIASAPT